MKTRTLLLLGCLLALASHAATTKREMWTWKDAQGVTHFSDTPVPGARKIEIVGSTPIASPSPAPPTPAVSTAQPEKKVREYESLEFTSPEPDEFFYGPETDVRVALAIKPGLMEGDELVWYLDGNRVDEATNSGTYSFKSLPRGTHTVVAVIRAADGEERIRAMSRSFTVRQEATNNPRNVGPALKPKPTPRPAPAPAPPPKSNK